MVAVDGAAGDLEGPVLSLAGRLLVATPALTQPEFERTVVLLLEHGPEGALGVVLNRPLPVPVGAELPEWAASPVLAEPEVVFDGGPVEGDCVLLVALARAGLPGGLPAGLPVTAGMVVVPFSIPPEEAAAWAEGVRVFAGYAGWGGGQLEDELEGGYWYVVDSLPADLVRADPSTLWRSVLRRQPGDLALVSTWTADPDRN